jgi:uncharacterized Tic20 family protein
LELSLSLSVSQPNLATLLVVSAVDWPSTKLDGMVILHFSCLISHVVMYGSDIAPVVIVWYAAQDNHQEALRWKREEIY